MIIVNNIVRWRIGDVTDHKEDSRFDSCPDYEEITIFRYGIHSVNMENLFGGSERRAFIFKTLNTMVAFLLIVAILYLASINNNTKH